MPIYEYRCKKCDRQFEYLVLGQNDSDVVCPYCGDGDTEKLLSTVSVMGGRAISSCGSGSTGGFS